MTAAGMEDGAELNTGTPDVDRVQELFAGLNSAMVCVFLSAFGKGECFWN